VVDGDFGGLAAGKIFGYSAGRFVAVSRTVYNAPPMLTVTFLGTGTSTGVPVVGCRCRICTSDDPKNKRLRQSVKVETGGRTFLIDTTPDLRAQLLRDPIPHLDFILFTHSHSDHLMGLDDIRPFNFRQREPIHAFASPHTARAIRRAFSYIWNDTQIGGGKPQLELHEVDGAFTHDGVEIVPIPVLHGEWTILGYRIGGFAYITDTNGIPEESMRLLDGIEILALEEIAAKGVRVFTFVLSPLKLVGATGSPARPLALRSSPGSLSR